jgi:hypothetical protein
MSLQEVSIGHKAIGIVLDLIGNVSVTLGLVYVTGFFFLFSF